MAVRIAITLVSAVLLLAIAAFVRGMPEAARSDGRAVSGDATPPLRAMVKETPPSARVPTPAPTVSLAVAPVQVTVEAPRVVSAQEPFDVHLRVDARAGVHRLLLAVDYDRKVLALTGVSEGDFAQRAGLPADFATDEPSDGNLKVGFTVRDSLALTGTGDLAVLHFEPRKPGTVTIAVPALTAYDGAGAARFSDANSRAAIITVY
jgi:hypothetical protein